jgi:hypothetical protein
LPFLPGASYTTPHHRVSRSPTGSRAISGVAPVGVHHADLNAHNNVLARLHRSLVKIHAGHGTAYVDRQWPVLLQGCAAGSEQ